MIRILIVDDQNFTRQAVKSILEQESDFEVVGEAENGIKALTKIAEIKPKVVVPIAIATCWTFNGVGSSLANSL